GQGLPGGEINGVADKTCAAVAQGQVHAAGMVAARGHDQFAGVPAAVRTNAGGAKDGLAGAAEVIRGAAVGGIGVLIQRAFGIVENAAQVVTWSAEDLGKQGGVTGPVGDAREPNFAIHHEDPSGARNDVGVGGLDHGAKAVVAGIAATRQETVPQ